MDNGINVVDVLKLCAIFTVCGGDTDSSGPTKVIFVKRTQFNRISYWASKVGSS